MDTGAGQTDTLIVLGAEQASFYEFVKERQPGLGRTLVVLDRRRDERRKQDQKAGQERRRADRRAPPAEAALALMSVLGFMILHKDGNRWVP